MADLSIDASGSYPKPPAAVSPFEMANQYGGLLQRQQALQSGQLTIQTQKLENANLGLTHLLAGLNSLGPNATRDQLMGLGKNLVKSGLVPPEIESAMEERIPTDPKQMPAFIDSLQTQAANHQEMIQHFLGQPDVTLNDGSTVKVLRVPTSPNYQGSTVATAPVQLPPTTPTVGPAQQPGYVGPSGAPGVTFAPAANGARAGIPAAVQLPAPAMAPAPAATITAPANPAFATPAPAKDQSRMAQGNFVPSGPPQLYNEGKAAWTADQDLATARQTAIKPALQALPLLKQLQFAGPGTKEYTTIIAALKNIGILSTNTNDPTAIQQEVEKKLAQYVGGNPVGQRSDAAQTLAEAGSPNPNHQIRPALIQLTKDSIVLDRLAAARANAFQDANGNQRTDLENYPAFRSKFPASIDERAFGLDLMEPDDRKKLLDDMKKKTNTPEGQKFWKSLQTVKNQGIYNITGQQ